MMNELSLHIIDLVQNSVRAKANFVEIILIDNEKRDEILMVVKDNGTGIRNEEIEKVINPFYTTKKNRKVGLGISLLHQTAVHCGGDFRIISLEGKGTTIIAKFKKSHLDLPPLGNIEDTIISLLTLTDQMDFKFVYKKGGNSFIFDTRILKEFTDGVFLTHPEVLKFIKSYIREGLNLIEQKTKGGKPYDEGERIKNSRESRLQKI